MDEILVAVMDALGIDDPELVDQPSDTHFQKGTVYADGGYDFQEIYCHRGNPEQEVIVFWSHVDQKASAAPVKA